MTPLERNQNFFHLSCIQAVSLGIPVIIIGKQLAFLYGAGTAICSILIGNLILWLISLTIISMVDKESINAIKNVTGYIGKYGGFLFALILVFVFLNWYVLQINQSILSLLSLFKPIDSYDKSYLIQIGASFGFFIALLAIGGIRLLRWMSVISFPFLVSYSICSIGFSEPSLLADTTWQISFPGILSTIMLLLPGIINLPTFFRHSQSKPHSYLALTCMFIFISFFECSSIWMHFSSGLDFISVRSSNFLTSVLPTALFLIMTLIPTNLLNIYLASASYETFTSFEGTKGHTIMGLLGTAFYTFVQVSSPIQYLEFLFNNYVAILGIVLLIAVLTRLIVQHRPRKFEKMINGASWLFGCLVSTIFTLSHFKKFGVFFHKEDFSPLLYGISASILFFLFIYFIEETAWSLQKLREGNEANTS